MRTIAAEIALPADCPVTRAATVLVEVRDVSLADAPSVVVAEIRLSDVELRPEGRIGVSIPVPEVPDTRSLAFRIHVSLDGSGSVKPGDLLTTASHSVPSRGAPRRLTVPVALV